MERELNCESNKKKTFVSVTSPDLLNTEDLKTLDQHVKDCQSCGSIQSQFHIIKQELTREFLRTNSHSILITPDGPDIKKNSNQKPTHVTERTQLQILRSITLILLAIVLLESTPYLYRSVDQVKAYLSEWFRANSQTTITKQEGHKNLAPELIAGGENDEFSDSESEDPESENKVKFGSQIWRFNFYTYSTSETKREIQNLLAIFSGSIDKGDQKTLSNGLEFPGGIQYSFLLQSESLNDLKERLARIQKRLETTQVTQALGTQRSPFTWYKSKSKTPIKPGYLKIVIWISQI